MLPMPNVLLLMLAVLILNQLVRKMRISCLILLRLFVRLMHRQQRRKLFKSVLTLIG